MAKPIYNNILSPKSSFPFVTASDFLNVSHHGIKTQFLIDHIYSDIKIQKKNLKKTNYFTGLFKSFFDSFIKTEFENKLAKYKNELNESTEILDTYYYGGATVSYFTHIDKFRDYEKRQTLLEIIAVLNELIKGHSESHLEKLAELESTLKEINGEQENCIVYVNEFYPVITEIKASIKANIKGLRKKLPLLIRFKYRMVGRDIRESFRNIIRIIFKNMDDQSGDDDNLFVYNFIQLQIINQKFWFHEQEINYRSASVYYRY